MAGPHFERRLVGRGSAAGDLDNEPGADEADLAWRHDDVLARREVERRRPAGMVAGQRDVTVQAVDADLHHLSLVAYGLQPTAIQSVTLRTSRDDAVAGSHAPTLTHPSRCLLRSRGAQPFRTVWECPGKSEPVAAGQRCRTPNGTCKEGLEPCRP